MLVVVDKLEESVVEAEPVVTGAAALEVGLIEGPAVRKVSQKHFV